MLYYVPKNSILFAGNGAVKISSVACGFSRVKIDYSDYPKSYISRIKDFFFHKNHYSVFFFYDIIVESCICLFRCNRWQGFCDANITLSKSMKVDPL